MRAGAQKCGLSQERRGPPAGQGGSAQREAGEAGQGFQSPGRPQRPDVDCDLCCPIDEGGPGRALRRRVAGSS